MCWSRGNQKMSTKAPIMTKSTTPIAFDREWAMASGNCIVRGGNTLKYTSNTAKTYVRYRFTRLHCWPIDITLLSRNHFHKSLSVQMDFSHIMMIQILHHYHTWNTPSPRCHRRGPQTNYDFSSYPFDLHRSSSVHSMLCAAKNLF
jgi:hypothetical protein